MKILDVTLEFLNNASVAAFFGAAFAFLLVFLTDLRRSLKRKRVFLELLASCVELAERKRLTLEANRNLVESENTVQPGEIQSFPIEELAALRNECWTHLSSKERDGAQAFMFRMKGADNVIAIATEHAEELYSLIVNSEGIEEQARLRRRLLIDYEAAIKNMEHIEQLGSLFVQRKFKEMKNWSYTLTRSEDVNGPET